MSKFTKEQVLKNRKKWIETLKTTKLPQGTEELGSPATGYCCLGIGCVLYEQDTGIELLKKEGKYAIRNSFLDVLHGTGCLEGDGYDEVREWLGLRDSTGEAQHGSMCSLATLNDEEDYTFKAIAKHLEEYGDAYFEEL